MSRPYIELPEASGRTVATLRVYEDAPSGREVHLVFTDGTQMSIDIDVATTVIGKHYKIHDGGLDVLARHESLPARRVFD